MAALERYYLSKGIKVAGYDRTATDLTRALADEGVEISYEQGADVIPDYCRNAADTLVAGTTSAILPPEGSGCSPGDCPPRLPRNTKYAAPAATATTTAKVIK